jgi:hypothetical protein
MDAAGWRLPLIQGLGKSETQMPQLQQRDPWQLPQMLARAVQVY